MAERVATLVLHRSLTADEWQRLDAIFATIVADASKDVGGNGLVYVFHLEPHDG